MKTLTSCNICLYNQWTATSINHNTSDDIIDQFSVCHTSTKHDACIL